MSSLDPGLRAYVDRVSAAPAAWELPLEELRAGPELESAEIWGATADSIAEVRDVVIASGDLPLRARIYRPQSSGALPCLVWLHGGGWVVGSIESHDLLCRALAARTPCCVIAVDYRLAPEHPFPAAVDDAWTGLVWASHAVEALGIDGARIAVGGDSAGGNLAAVTALAARDNGLALCLQVLAYPVTDSDFESESYRSYASGLNLTREKMRWYWGLYLAGRHNADPRAAPLRADNVGGVAPALIQLAEYDPLWSEGDAYGRRLAEAGVETTVTSYAGTIHGFLRMPALTSAADQAVSEIAEALTSSGHGRLPRRS